MIGPAGVHTAAVLQRHTLVVAEDEAWVALATLHAHVLAAGGRDYPQTRLWTGTGTQSVGAVGRTFQGCTEGWRNGRWRTDDEDSDEMIIVIGCSLKKNCNVLGNKLFSF